MKPPCALLLVVLCLATAVNAVWVCSDVHRWTQMDGGSRGRGMGYGAWEHIRREAYDDCPGYENFAVDPDCAWSVMSYSHSMWGLRPKSYSLIGGWFAHVCTFSDDPSWHSSDKSAICWRWAEDYKIVLRKGDRFLTHSIDGCPLVLRTCAKSVMDGFKCETLDSYKKIKKVTTEDALLEGMGWTCPPETYHDGECNCGCGIWDPDCGQTISDINAKWGADAQECPESFPYCNPVYMGVRCSAFATKPDTAASGHSSFSSFTASADSSCAPRRRNRLTELVKENKLAFYKAGATEEDKRKQFVSAVGVTEALTKAVDTFNSSAYPGKPIVYAAAVDPISAPEALNFFVDVDVDDSISEEVAVSFDKEPPSDVMSFFRSFSGSVSGLSGSLVRSSGASAVASSVASRQSAEALSRSFTRSADAIDSLAGLLPKMFAEAVVGPIAYTFRVAAKAADKVREAADAMILALAKVMGFCQSFMTDDMCRAAVVEPILNAINDARVMIDKFKKSARVMTMIFTLGFDAETMVGGSADIGIYVTVYRASGWKFKLGVCSDVSVSLGTSVQAGLGASVGLTTIFDEFRALEAPHVWKIPIYIGFELGLSLHASAHIILKNVPELEIFQGVLSPEDGLTRMETFHKNLKKLKDMITRCTIGTNASAVVDPDAPVNVDEGCFLGFGILIRAGIGVAADGKFIDIRLSHRVWSKSIDLIGADPDRTHLVEHSVNLLAPGAESFAPSSSPRSRSHVTELSLKPSLSRRSSNSRDTESSTVAKPSLSKGSSITRTHLSPTAEDMFPERRLDSLLSLEERTRRSLFRRRH